MQRIMPSATVFLLLAAAAPAQISDSRQPPATQDISRSELQRFLWEVENRQSQAQQEAAARRDAQYQQREFEKKVNRVAEIWNKLFGNYRQQHIFNIKDARDLSKAFHELEAMGWPK